MTDAEYKKTASRLRMKIYRARVKLKASRSIDARGALLVTIRDSERSIENARQIWLHAQLAEAA